MKKNGFTLVELMIVVAVIAILAALALPSITRSRANTNEASAATAIRSIATAAIGYRSTHSFYPANMAALTATTPTYVDTALGAGAKNSYNFLLSGGTSGFSATCRPSGYQVTGTRSFYVDESGVVRWTSEDRPAAATDPVLSE